MSDLLDRSTSRSSARVLGDQALYSENISTSDGVLRRYEPNDRVLLSVDSVTGTPPGGATTAAPSTLFEELTSFVRLASMGLTGDSSARLAPSSPGSSLRMALSNPAGWSGVLLIDANGTVASDLKYPVSMTMGGKQSLMPATVFSSLTWGNVAARDPVMTGGNAVALPLGISFVLGSTQATNHTSIVAERYDLFPLQTEIETYATVVFGYGLDTQDQTVTPLDISGVPSGQLAEWLINHGHLDPSSTSKTVIIAVYDLSLTSPRDDFQPTNGSPQGPAEVIRTYPILSIWSSRALQFLEGELQIVRPSITPMDGMALGGAIGASLFTDMNVAGRSLWDELSPAIKLALAFSAAAGSPFGSLGPAAGVYTAFTHLPSTRWDSLFAHYALNAGRSGVKVVAPELGRRGDTTARQEWNSGTRSYQPTNVVKVERQGVFDNVHIAPAMDYNGNVAFMAPLCDEDCLHVHWRWGAWATDQPLWGWAAGKPYQKPGAPMIPENQTLHVSTNGSTLSYMPSAENISAQTWQIFMHHGTGYVTSLTPVGKLAPMLEWAQMTSRFPGFAPFYFHNRIIEDGSIFRNRLDESKFGALETL